MTNQAIAQTLAKQDAMKAVIKLSHHQFEVTEMDELESHTEHLDTIELDYDLEFIN